MAMSYPQQPHQPPQQPPPYTPPPAASPRKPKRWPWILGIIGALLLGIIIGNAGNSKTGSNSARETVTVRVPAPAGTAPAQTAQAEAPPPAQTGPATSMGNGTYQVGVDVQPGQYKTAGPEGDIPCYWARRKDDSGSFEAIIANGTPEGPSSLTINQGEFVELSGGCTWNKVG